MNRRTANLTYLRHLTYLISLATSLAYAPAAFCQTQAPASKGASSDSATAFSGKVAETMSTAGYTYVLVDTGKAKTWAAAPQFSVKVGDTVAVADGMPMPNYHSKTLNRDFDLVVFTGNVKVNGALPGAGATPSAKSGALPEGHPPISGAPGSAADAKPTIDLTGIKKAEGGKTIAEIYSDKSKLGGKKVKVRGRVVKYNAEIMGKNWIHIQDGTGAAGSNDLAVTTAAKTKVGDLILVNGTVAINKDFGGGYQYTVIVEDAQLTVE
jgi:hypothetical protein